MIDTDRQTGRTTRLMQEAKERIAHFIVLTLDQKNYCSALIPDFDRERIHVLRRGLGQELRSSVAIADHAVISHGDPALIAELRPILLTTRSERSSLAVKYDDEKPRHDLLPGDALDAIARVLTYGANKYAARNWEKGMNWGRMLGAMMRHTWAFWQGEELDPESGLPHLSHAACCALMLLTYYLRRIGDDDRMCENRVSS